MFTKIRNHLTMVYAAVMICYLLAFIIASYSGLVWVLYREEQRGCRGICQRRSAGTRGCVPADSVDWEAAGGG